MIFAPIAIWQAGHSDTETARQSVSQIDIKTAEWTGCRLSVNYFWMEMEMNETEWNQIKRNEIKWAESTNRIEWAPRTADKSIEKSHRKANKHTAAEEERSKIAFNFFNLAFTFLINFSLAIKIQFLLKNQVR